MRAACNCSRKSASAPPQDKKSHNSQQHQKDREQKIQLHLLGRQFFPRFLLQFFLFA